ncbi:MAG: hypothetical protein QMD36_03945 [Candidatus Aenigmarchaeota archaeon]|nr:hypothetical protein [Candidatus Aenigmarchaeota archaeon]
MKKIIIGFILIFLIISGMYFYNKTKVKPDFVANMSTEKKVDLFFVYEIVKYPSNVEIIESEKKSNITLGMTGDPWNLNFGIIPIGTESRRFMNLANKKEEIYKVEIYVYGNISPMVSFDRNNFILRKGDEVKVTALLNSTLSKGAGKFMGEIDIVSKRARIPFLNVIL